MMLTKQCKKQITPTVKSIANKIDPNQTAPDIQESPPQFENPIMARVYVRSTTRSTMYQKAPFC